MKSSVKYYLIHLRTVDINKLREKLGEKSKEFSSIINNKDYF
jgi:hypothetical protein